MTITLVAAIGRQGQLGLNGGLPWGKDFASDRHRFRVITAGCLVLVGHHTWDSVADLQGTAFRIFYRDRIRSTPDDLAEHITRRHPGRSLVIAGGAKTYRRWLPHVSRFDVTLLPYDGPADVYADFLLPHVTREHTP